MRRKDREIIDRQMILEIMKKCDVCSLAFYDDNYPYIIPINFGVSMEENEIVLYFHCAKEGRKLELLKKNNHVAFEMNCAHKLITGEVACDATMEFESVCGNGSITVVDEADKKKGLSILMNQYIEETDHVFDERYVKAVNILKLTVNEISGKALKHA